MHRPEERPAQEIPAPEPRTPSVVSAGPGYGAWSVPAIPCYRASARARAITSALFALLLGTLLLPFVTIAIGWGEIHTYSALQILINKPGEDIGALFGGPCGNQVLDGRHAPPRIHLLVVAIAALAGLGTGLRAVGSRHWQAALAGISALGGLIWLKRDYDALYHDTQFEWFSLAIGQPINTFEPGYWAAIAVAALATAASLAVLLHERRLLRRNEDINLAR